MTTCEHKFVKRADDERGWHVIECDKCGFEIRDRTLIGKEMS